MLSDMSLVCYQFKVMPNPMSPARSSKGNILRWSDWESTVNNLKWQKTKVALWVRVAWFIEKKKKWNHSMQHCLAEVQSIFSIWNLCVMRSTGNLLQFFECSMVHRCYYWHSRWDVWIFVSALQNCPTPLITFWRCSLCQIPLLFSCASIMSIQSGSFHAPLFPQEKRLDQIY